jgi:hypothetical protein
MIAMPVEERRCDLDELLLLVTTAHEALNRNLFVFHHITKSGVDQPP